MNLKKSRLDAGMKQCDLVALLKKADKRMTVPILSMIENGLVSPNSRIKAALEQIFPAEASGSPAKPEINFGLHPYYKLTVRVPLKVWEGVADKMQSEGYGTTGLIIDLIQAYKLKKA